MFVYSNFINKCNLCTLSFQSIMHNHFKKHDSYYIRINALGYPLLWIRLLLNFLPAGPASGILTKKIQQNMATQNQRTTGDETTQSLVKLAKCGIRVLFDS